MSFKITFDASKLAGAAKTLQALAAIPSRASAPISKALSDRLHDQFASGHDPYGDPWQPLKPVTYDRREGNRGGPLEATGALMDGTMARPLAGAGVSLLAGAAYGVFHQTGNAPGSQQPSGMQARPIFPFKGIPAEWNSDIQEVISDLVKEAS